MKDIIIIAKVIVGVRPNPFGMDGGLNIFKKSLSEILKEKLNQKLKEKNMDYKVNVDSTYDDLKNLIQDEDTLLLISPYIKDKVDIEDISKNNYYILSENEFNDGYVEDIITHLENKKR
ncbi:hypothetical protein [Clostridium beijerinckii]|uniref:hypothetical protein n=1 Tax=Clostridium beijerinckii TaxID=1520 RepID=UPI00098C69E6|nr:hypothetical protein [Clostridium beijerinckii]MBA8933809.1 hypothetical protein [Clostridium beijerinckii]NRT36278.1 hypothetical protein [Clostridium beijerinckii]NRT44294.1 hypothetical protein [Clostridium beijerinckii]NRU38005.1 hypothetical protein [Clostridium beijerinckii]NRZ21713.1 hypothetical protein [Clostridium beijerinckii]